MTTDKKQPATKKNTKSSTIQGRKLSPVQVIAVIVLAMAFFIMVDLGHRVTVNYRIQREAEQLNQQVELAQLHQQELLARRSYVASDLFVEEVARKELKWAKSGETVIVILPTSELALPPNANVPAVQTKVVQTPQTEGWWVLFFGE
jgi:cell division protein FtsB